VQPVIRKLIVAGLVSLFTWNAVFGAFGGLLLCFHDDRSLHPELAAGAHNDCDAGDAGDAMGKGCLSELESCVDLELKAIELPDARVDDGQHSPVFTPHCSPLPETGDLNFGLWERAHFVQAQAPPALPRTSVLVAQATNLRI
jgi:hypothetical protein